jgi:nucleotide-binding universal stress UspA family protein
MHRPRFDLDQTPATPAAPRTVLLIWINTGRVRGRSMARIVPRLPTGMRDGRTSEVNMFKHILIATDGSRLAKKAEKAGIAIAKKIGACVTGYHALHEPHFRHSRFPDTDAQIEIELERRAREAGEKYVADMGRAAQAAGVPFEPVVTTADAPSSGIVEAAKRHHCDAIVIASHGRSGLPAMLLGSVTQEVLARSGMPVLVFR